MTHSLAVRQTAEGPAAHARAYKVQRRRRSLPPRLERGSSTERDRSAAAKAGAACAGTHSDAGTGTTPGPGRAAAARRSAGADQGRRRAGPPRGPPWSSQQSRATLRSAPGGRRGASLGRHVQRSRLHAPRRFAGGRRRGRGSVSCVLSQPANTIRSRPTFPREKRARTPLLVARIAQVSGPQGRRDRRSWRILERHLLGCGVMRVVFRQIGQALGRQPRGAVEGAAAAATAARGLGVLARRRLTGAQPARAHRRSRRARYCRSRSGSTCR